MKKHYNVSFENDENPCYKHKPDYEFGIRVDHMLEEDS